MRFSFFNKSFNWDGIQAFVFFLDKPVEKSLLYDWLDLLLNIKGSDVWLLIVVVNFVDPAGPTIINAIQHVLHSRPELDLLLKK